MTYVEHPELLDSYSETGTKDPGSRLLNAASYLGAVGTTLTGFSTTWMIAAMESVDHHQGNNLFADKLSLCTGAASVIVGSMGALVLRKLNQQK